MATYGFASLSTIAMSAVTALSLAENYLEQKGNEHPLLNKFIRPIKDLCLKIRMLAQYSIHANPGSPKMACDDMLKDSNHNLAATNIGIKVYSYYAFKGLWVWLAKHILVPSLFSKNFIGKTINKLLNIYDMTMGRAASIYWNWRRTSMSMTPYSPDGMTSEEVEKANEKVKGVMGLFLAYLSPILINPLAAIANPFLSLFGKSSDQILKKWKLDKETLNSKAKNIAKEYGVEGKSKELVKLVSEYFQQNIKILNTGKYTINDQERVLGEDSPSKEPWYTKSKLISKILGLPVGVIGTICNVTSIGLGVIAELFGKTNIQKWSDKATAIGTALMSILYTTGEIPAHLNEIQQGLKKGEFRLENLGILATGILGSIGSFLRIFKDSVNKTIFPLFYLFFSWNRLKLHREDYKDVCQQSTQKEVLHSEKYNKYIKYLGLVPRVWLRLDEDKNENEKVTYPTSIKELRERFKTMKSVA